MPATITIIELTAEDEQRINEEIAMRREEQRKLYESALSALADEEAAYIRELRDVEVRRRVLNATHPGAPRGLLPAGETT